MRQTPRFRMVGLAGFVLAAVVIFLYLGKVDVTLIYYWQQIAPFSFLYYISSPGGFSHWLAYQYIISMQTVTTGLITCLLVVLVVFLSLFFSFNKRQSDPFFYPVLLAGLIPLVSTFSYYRFPADVLISLVIGYLFFAIYMVPTFRFRWGNAVFAILLGLASFWLAGSAALAFILQGVIVKSMATKKYSDLASLVPLLAIPMLILPIDLSCTWRHAYLGTFMISKYDLIPNGVYLSLLIPLAVAIALRFLPGLKSLRTLYVWLISIAGILVAVAGMTVAARYSIQKDEKYIYGVLKAGVNRDWDEVLSRCQGDVKFNNLIQFEINRALQYRGELLDKMFFYPQQYGEEGIMLENFLSSRIALHISEFYYDLGWANECRHWSAEAEMVLMQNPVVLKNLAMSFAASGMKEASLKYLRILGRSKTHREWCREIEAMLMNGTIKQDPDIARFIRNNPQRDFFASAKRPVDKLSVYFENDPGNRQAFEFLMANLLLQHNLGKIMNKIVYFRVFKYEELPRHIQEAICIYITRTKATSINIAEYDLDKDVIEDFKKFSMLIGSTDNPVEQMQKASAYSGTYWYYILFKSPYAHKN